MRNYQKYEKGTVLLTTLLIMTMMAALTIALMDDIRVAVKRTINVQAYSQADWQARGAEDFVSAYLQNDFQALEPVVKAGLLQSREPLVLPTPDGVITVTLKDASHCFNLNALVNAEGAVEDNARLEFGRLAELLGVPTGQATVLSNVLKDWQDSDQQISPGGGAEDNSYLLQNPPYRTADTALRSPDEMRSLQGMDENLWELFKPFVCTGPAGRTTEINVNSLSSERLIILAAALSVDATVDEAVTAAQAILSNRPALGYTNDDEFLEVITNLGIEGIESSDRMTTDVKAMFVEVVTQVGPAERVRTYRYDDVETVPTLSYRGWGRETFRPEIETELEAGE